MSRVDFHHISLNYPVNMRVDFRKLSKDSLLKILKHYQINANPEISQPDLAILAARMFGSTLVPEEDVVVKFLDKCFPAENTDQSQQPQQPAKKQISPVEELNSTPAIVGEQVAAKVSKTNEEGSWILGNVLSFDMKTGFYVVQDEDDKTRVVNLYFTEVRRLLDTSSHLKRGDEVYAVYPDTTSFYPAVICKTPRPPSGSNDWDVIVKFNDDKDDFGKVPPRKIPSRFVVRRCDIDGLPEPDLK